MEMWLANCNPQPHQDTSPRVFVGVLLQIVYSECLYPSHIDPRNYSRVDDYKDCWK